LVNSEKERRRRSLLLLLLFPRESERSSQAFKKTTPYVFLGLVSLLMGYLTWTS
jgi:hypothetical protein